MSDNGTSRTPTPFFCPRCSKESWYPEDKVQGYCGACHDWTGREIRIVLRFDSDVRQYLIDDLRHASSALGPHSTRRAFVDEIADQIEREARRV